MQTVYFVDRQGQIVSKVISPLLDAVLKNTPNNCIAIVLDDSGITEAYWDFDLHQFISMGEPPSPYHIFDYAFKQWFDPRTLDEIKAQKWQEIKKQRDRIEFGGFEFEGNIYDSDQVSQGRILGAASAGVDQVWTLADNSTRLLTASQLQQLYATLQMHIAAAHERGRIARQLIYEATSKEQIEAVNF